MARLGVRSNTKPPTALNNNIIYHILNNHFYYGMMRIKDKLYPHRHGNLISKALFEKAQEVRTGWRKKPFKYASKPYILRGMIKCADCGCTITPERAKEHIYYSCTNYKKMHDKRIYVREEDLMKPIKEILKNIQLSDEKIKEIVEGLREINESQNKFNERAINNLRQEYDKIQKRISGMMDLRLDGSITEEMFDQKLKEYKERQYEIDEELKRQLLNFILQNLELKGKKLLFNLKTPFDTVLLANECSEMLGAWDKVGTALYQLNYI